MATTRIKDVSKTTTDLASDEYIIADGATNGTQKMARDDAYADWAAAYVAAPTTYKLAPLNSGTNKIDATYLPTGADTAKGAWDANANSPALADGAGTAGDYYDVTVAGSQDLGSGSIAYTVGDVVKYDGANWFKIDSVANILDGSATAADGRTTLEVDSSDDLAESAGTKLVGPSLAFDGSSYIEISDDDKFTFVDATSDTPFSISFWIKTGTTQTGTIIGKNLNSTTIEWLVRYTSGPYFMLGVYTTGGTSNYIRCYTSTTITENQLIHVAYTYDGSEDATGLNVYLNGVLSNGVRNGLGTYTGMSNTGAPVTIGKSSSAGLLSDGEIRQTVIHNRELSASEVEDLYRHGQLGAADQNAGAIATSGTLTVGKRYRLRDWITADDFTNVGAASNADGVEFIATGTTPTTWSNSSEVEAIGTLADFRAESYDNSTGKLYDISNNAFVGTSATLPTLVGREVPVYETGTWTPGLTLGGGTTGMTFTTQEGTYTRVGDQVTVKGTFTLSALGSDTGTALITGLPFTAANTTGSYQSLTIGSMANAASLATAPSAVVTDNATTVSLYDWGATGTAVLDNTNFGNTTSISFSGTYQIQ